jgi:acyl carrier protein
MVAARPKFSTPNALAIQSWLVEGIAHRTGIDPAFIDVNAPASGLLDSLDAVDLSGEAAAFLGIEVSPALLWEAKSLAELAAALAEQAGRPRHVLPPKPATPSDSAPLSLAQKSQYERAVLQGAGAESNCVAALRCSGALDEHALQSALDAAVRRHDALRVSFQHEHGRTRQRVAPAAPSPLRMIDLRSLPPSEREIFALRIAKREACTEIETSQAPLLRATLIQLANDEHVLVLVVHHLVFDGLSLCVLVRDLGEHYNAARAGLPGVVSLPPLRYLDLLSWQQAQIEGARGEEQLGYWQRQLSGAELTVSLPADRPRPAQRAFTGAAESFAILPPTAERLSEVCTRAGCTPFMFLLAAYYALLHHESGQQDLTICTAAANRSHPLAREVVGYFANVVALRVRLDPKATVSQLLLEVRRVVGEALAHQEVPFERVLTSLGIDTSKRQVPVPQVTFLMHENPFSGVAFDELALAPFGDAKAGGLGVHNGTISVDLALTATPAAGGFVGGLQYDLELFDRDRVERLVAAYVRVVEHMAQRPECRIEELGACLR